MLPFICENIKTTNKEHTTQKVGKRQTSLQTHPRRLLRQYQVSKKKYFINRIDKAANSNKELYKILKEFTYPSPCQSSNPSSQAWVDMLSTFFEEKINTIHNTFSHYNINNYYSESDTNPEFATPLLEEFTELIQEEVRSALSKIKSGSPEDPVSLHILSTIAPSFLKNLTDLFKMSFNQAIVPIKWKAARVKPILKKASTDPKEPSNYHPISLLPYFGKVLEPLVKKQLTTYLESHELLNPSQSGFRAAHSTETSLVDVVDDIILAQDNRQSAMLVLLDLSAAFDTISHSILEQRLWEMGVRGTALDWLRNYLTDRTSTVQLGTLVSRSRLVDMGVPQGSILSPMLFNLYVAPLAKVIRSYGFNVVLYTDDTLLLITLGPNPTGTRLKFKNCMIHINNWMQINHLQFNASKTEVILFGKAQEFWSNDWWPQSLGPCPSLKTMMCNLGVKIDNQLSMKEHVNHIMSTCYGLMRSLRKIFQWIPIESKKLLVQGLIISWLNYGNALMASINEELYIRLLVL